MSGIIKWIVITVVVLGGAWFAWTSGMFKKPAPTPAPQAVENTAPTVTPEPENTNGMSLATDASDPAIIQDITAVDTQLGLAATDMTNIDVSLSDKPVIQLY